MLEYGDRGVWYEHIYQHLVGRAGCTTKLMHSAPFSERLHWPLQRLYEYCTRKLKRITSKCIRKTIVRLTVGNIPIVPSLFSKRPRITPRMDAISRLGSSSNILDVLMWLSLEFSPRSRIPWYFTANVLPGGLMQMCSVINFAGLGKERQKYNTNAPLESPNINSLVHILEQFIASNFSWPCPLLDAYQYEREAEYLKLGCT